MAFSENPNFKKQVHLKEEYCDLHLKDNSEKANFISSKKTPPKEPGLLGGMYFFEEMKVFFLNFLSNEVFQDLANF